MFSLNLTEELAAHPELVADDDHARKKSGYNHIMVSVRNIHDFGVEWYTGVQCVSCVAIFQVTDRFLSHFCCRYGVLIVDTTNGEDVGMVVTEHHNNCMLLERMLRHCSIQ